MGRRLPCRGFLIPAVRQNEKQDRTSANYIGNLENRWSGELSQFRFFSNEQEGNMFIRKSLLFTILVWSAIATVHATFLWAQETSKKTLRVNGAGMASAQVQKWAESFMQANPDTNILVVGSSAGAGFQALFNRSADLAMASRLISADEQKQ